MAMKGNRLESERALDKSPRSHPRVFSTSNLRDYDQPTGRRDTLRPRRELDRCFLDSSRSIV